MYTKNRVWQAGDIPTAAHFNHLEQGVYASDAGRLCFIPQHYDTATGTYVFDTGRRFSLANGEVFCFCVENVNKKAVEISTDNMLSRPVRTIFQGAPRALPGGRIVPGRIYRAVYLAKDDCFMLDMNGCRAEYFGETVSADLQELFISGNAGCRLSLSPDSALAFSVLAVAQSGLGGIAGAWTLSGVARRGADDVSVAGAVVKAFLGGDEAVSAYDISAQADVTAQALAFFVRGDALGSVRWRLCVDYVESRL